MAGSISDSQIRRSQERIFWRNHAPFVLVVDQNDQLSCDEAGMANLRRCKGGNRFRLRWHLHLNLCPLMVAKLSGNRKYKKGKFIKRDVIFIMVILSSSSAKLNMATLLMSGLVLFGVTVYIPGVLLQTPRSSMPPMLRRRRKARWSWTIWSRLFAFSVMRTAANGTAMDKARLRSPLNEDWPHATEHRALDIWFHRYARHLIAAIFYPFANEGVAFLFSNFAEDDKDIEEDKSNGIQGGIVSYQL